MLNAVEKILLLQGRRTSYSKRSMMYCLRKHHKRFDILGTRVSVGGWEGDMGVDLSRLRNFGKGVS